MGEIPRDPSFAQKPKKIDAIDARQNGERRIYQEMPLRDFESPQQREVWKNLHAEKKDLEDQIRALQSKKSTIESRIKDIDNIPHLFDDQDLASIETKLHNLSNIGIADVQVGDRKYKMEELEKILSECENIARLRNGGKSLLKTEREIDNALATIAEIGATRQKISSESTSGFREALRRGIIDYSATMNMSGDDIENMIKDKK